MAMKTTKTSPAQYLRRRLRLFYRLLNERCFDRCYKMIDPRVRLKQNAVTFYQYQNALSDFLDEFGRVDVRECEIALHVNEPNKLYEGRDFALGRLVWMDCRGAEHRFSERWVKEEKTWYTRSTGFVVPISG